MRWFLPDRANMDSIKTPEEQLSLNFFYYYFVILVLSLS